MRGMISLIGEQPIPNLLPLRHLRPEQAVFVHTKLTQKTAENLQKLVEREGRISTDLLLTDPYDIARIEEDLKGRIRERGWADSDLVFNLTGGTKTMVLAAYRVAEAHRAPFVYLQSEGKRSRLYRYEFGDRGYRLAEDHMLPGLLTIDDYIWVHMGRYPEPARSKEDLGSRFEQALQEALEGCVDEVKRGVILSGALELDLVVRLGNQVGVIQAKTGKKAMGKEGLDQLKAACGRENLGTYTVKILAINQRWDPTMENLRELAEAWQITVIELPSFTEQSPVLSPEDQKRLRSEVRRALGG